MAISHKFDTEQLLLRMGRDIMDYVFSGTIRKTVAWLLPKLKLKRNQREAAWAATLKLTEKEEKVRSAMSHTPRSNASLPMGVVYFKKHPYEGIVRLRVRKTDGNVRILLT